MNKQPIDFLDPKFTGIKGLPFYQYEDGFIIFRDEEYWGHANPIEITYTLVSPNGDEEDQTWKGSIREDVAKWDKKHGKKRRIDDE